MSHSKHESGVRRKAGNTTVTTAATNTFDMQWACHITHNFLPCNNKGTEDYSNTSEFYVYNFNVIRESPTFTCTELSQGTLLYPHSSSPKFNAQSNLGADFQLTDWCLHHYKTHNFRNVTIPCAPSPDSMTILTSASQPSHDHSITGGKSPWKGTHSQTASHPLLLPTSC